MYLSQLAAKLTQHSQEGIAFLQEQMRCVQQTQLTHQSLPQDIYLVTAAEVKVLLDKDVCDFIESLQDQGFNIHLVSAACTSFHAALLDFEKTEKRAALVFMVELNQSIQQGCLNALGIGNEPEQDGLEVLTGVGFAYVSQDSNQQNAIHVSNTEILSQPIGMHGTTHMIKLLKQRLSKLAAETQCVSFDICSQWGKSLMAGLTQTLSSFHTQSWLPSYEKTQQHVLSLKPILELIHYRKQLATGPLFIMTLGGGGRIGCLWLQNASKRSQFSLEDSTYKDAHSLETESKPLVNNILMSWCCLSSDVQAFFQAINSNNKNNYYQQVQQTLKYPQKQYRGMNDHYFCWPFDELVWTQVRQLLNLGGKKTL